MTVERRRADGADVQVMGRCPGRGGEGLAVGNPKVAFVVVAEWLQPPDDVGEIAAVGDDDVEVDDRLGRETGDGGAADMFDGDREGAEGGGQPVAESLEGGGPARVVVDDDNRVGQDGLQQGRRARVGWSLMLPAP
jgi:hypothetical protein